MIPTISSPFAAERILPVSLRASDHHNSSKVPSYLRLMGKDKRCFFKPSYICLPLSETHSSFTSSLTRGRILISSAPLLFNSMFAPRPSETSTEYVVFNSHGQAVNVYGIWVRAPTGHRSAAFALNSLVTFASI